MSPSTQTVLVRSVRLFSVLALLGMGLMPVHAVPLADDVSSPSLSPNLFATCAPDGTQASGAKYRICMPAGVWNKDLIVYAHGYMAPNQPVRIPDEQLVLPDGTSITETVGFLGYAFATTSYMTNGLAIRQGLADLVDLVSIFKAAHSDVNHVYLVGASEGGLITTLAVEQYPHIFSGGLATCGPVGDFNTQVSYVGDVRVLFDYFFPGLLPPSPVAIPPTLMNNWDAYFATTILPVLSAPASAISVTQLLSVTQAAYGPVNLNATTVITTLYSVLWYNVFATNDAVAKLGGQPFDNHSRVYVGSLDDVHLNAGVQHFTATTAALNEIQAHYQTTGQLRVPLVTLHTIPDQTVPYAHETLYQAKVAAQGRTHRYVHIPVSRYGHCNFTSTEVVQALGLLQTLVLTQPPVDVDLSPGYSQAGKSGSAVVYNHIVTNTGTLSGTFVLQAASSQNWQVALLGGAYPGGTMQLPLLLDAGMTATVQVRLTVPEGITKTLVDYTVVTATSQISPTIFMTAVDTTRVYTQFIFLPIVFKNY